MEKFTRVSLITGIALLVYGYLARMLPVYFFWESKTFGWIFLVMALIGFLGGIIRSRRQQGKKTIWAKLGFWFLIFGLAILPIVVFMMKTSDAYETATDFLRSDEEIKKEIGTIKGFGLIPTGGVSTTSINGSESGRAEFNLTVRGTKKYKDITVSLVKTPETGWRVVSLE